MTLSSGTILLLYVTLQRLVELVIANRNTRALLARGAYEAGAEHYPVMVALHATWLVTLWIFGWNRPVSLVFLALFIVLQAGRSWVLGTLGARWTTRIVFGVLNLAMIGWRIRAENAAFARLAAAGS